MDKRRFAVPGKIRLGIGCFLAVCILAFGGFLLWMAYRYAPNSPEAGYGVLAVSVLLAIVFSMFDIAPDKKRDDAEAHRRRMLSMPSVTGHIEGIRRQWYQGGKQVTEEEARTLQHASCRYTLTVSFTDPQTNTIRQIESQEFAEDVETMLSGDLAAVHYSPEGETWVVPQQYREHVTDAPAFQSQSNDGLRFLAQKHPYLMFAVLTGIGLLAGIIVFLCARPH